MSKNYLVYCNTSGAYEGGDCFTLCERHLKELEESPEGEYADVYGTSDSPCGDCAREEREKSSA